jgi:hypothetical protein
MFVIEQESCFYMCSGTDSNISKRMECGSCYRVVTQIGFFTLDCTFSVAQLENAPECSPEATFEMEGEREGRERERAAKGSEN